LTKHAKLPANALANVRVSADTPLYVG